MKNYINDWGIKGYQPALPAEGRKACGSDYCNGENTSQRKLEMVTFHYTATGAIGFSRQGGEGNDPQDLQPTQDPQLSYAQSTIQIAQSQRNSEAVHQPPSCRPYIVQSRRSHKYKPASRSEVTGRQNPWSAQCFP